MNFNEQLKNLEAESKDKSLFKKLKLNNSDTSESEKTDIEENIKPITENAEIDNLAENENDSVNKGDKKLDFESENDINEIIINDEVKGKKKSSKNKRFRTTVSVMILILAVGVVGNWYWEKSDLSKTVKPVLSSITEKNKTIGEATYVDATTEPTTQSEYFSSARVERQKTRDEALENLKSIAKNSNVSESTKKEANEKINKISTYITIENKIETLVKAKGINNCLAIVSDDGQNVQIVVDSQKLEDKTVLQIKEIAIDQLGCSYDNISIIQSK